MRSRTFNLEFRFNGLANEWMTQKSASVLFIIPHADIPSLSVGSKKTKTNQNEVYAIGNEKNHLKGYNYECISSGF